MKRSASPPAPNPPAPPPLSAGVRRVVFPAAGAAQVPAAQLPDLAVFLRALAVELTRVVALPVAASRGRAAAASPGEGFVRDGLALAMLWPETLAAAVVAHRFGGDFAPAASGNAAPSVARLYAELDAAVLHAADTAWPGEGNWSPVPMAADAVPFAVALDIAGHGFDLYFAVRLPAAVPARLSPIAIAAWTRALRTALDAAPFDVRAVLHARPLRLEAALALRAGDVLPIETPRDVALRVGPHALARGTITPDADGGHRVTVTAAGDGMTVTAGTPAITPGAVSAPHEDHR